MLGTSKSIWGFTPQSVPGCTLWLDASDPSTMNSTTTVTQWNDKSGQSNNVTGTATLSGSNMTFNGTNQAFSNLTYVFPYAAYSLFAVYSNTVAGGYMNVVYGSNGYPMLGVTPDKSVTALSAAPTTMWATRIASGLGDSGYGVATDSSGNVFVIGNYAAALTLYNTAGVSNASLANAGGNDVFLAKYTSAGTVSWATRIASGVSDVGYGVATDSSGNVFVTGSYAAAVTLYNAGGGTGATLAYTGGADAFLAKYSSTGTVVWAAQIASTGDDIGQGVATDSSGNVFVTGWYGAALTLYNTGGTTGATLANTGGNDVFIAKYSSTGTVVWATRIAGTTTSSDIGNAVATDSSGNVFVAGYYNAALTLYNTGGGTGATLAYTGAEDVFLAKYSSTGTVVWATRIAGSTTSSDVAYGVATDSSGNVFVTGYYSAACTLYNTGGGTGATLAFTGGQDAFLAKYSSTGTVVWAARIAGTTTSSDNGYGVATDSSGNVFVTGYYSAALTLYNAGGTTGATIPFTGGYDVFLAKYSSTGTVVWAAQITGTTTSQDVGTGVATDSSGNVFVTGQYGAALTLYNTGGTTGATLAFTGGLDAFIAKYTSAGAVAQVTAPIATNVGWAARIAGTGADYGNGVATDPSGNVFVTGSYGAALTLYDSAGTSNASLAFTGGDDAYIAKYSSNGTVLWAAQITGTTTSSDYGNGVATDSSGNVFVSGLYSAACTLYNAGGTTGATLTFAGVSDAFLAKYSSTGTVLWAAQIMSTGQDSGQGVATDSSGNVFVTGYYSGALTLYNAAGVSNAALANAGSQDAYIAKYSSTGSVLWVARIAGTGQDSGNGVATDSSGNVFVSGAYFAALTLYNSSGVSNAALAYTGDTDAFIAKYSSTGTVVWATRIAGTTTSTDNGYAVATDSSGNVFVSGYYQAALTLYNTGGTTGATLANAGSFDVFLAKYSSTGTVLWAAQIAGTLLDQGRGVATDSSGNVFVTGYYGPALTLYNTSGTTGATLAYTGGNDVFLAKYSSTGTVLWAAQIAGAGDEVGQAVATDSSGNVFVTGYYGAALTLYNTGGTTGATLAFTGNNDAFIAKYSPDGYITIGTPANSNTLVSATYTPSTFSPFANGYSATALTGTTTATTGIYVGGPSNYFNGSLSELLVYNSTLNSNQRVLVEGYLARKWGAQTKLPTSHLYSSIPPFNRTFTPLDIPACSVWLDAADGSTMNSTTTVTQWNDKSGAGNNVIGTATLSGRNMTFDGSTQAFSNTSYVFPNSAYSMFAVYSNTTAPATTAYMNAVYGGNGYPMLGVYDVNKYVSARSVVANTGALSTTPANSNTLVSATYTPSTFSPFINGSNYSTLAGTTLATTGLYVGGPSNYFNGSLSELLIYASTLTATQRQQLEGYLTQKWGLSSQIVSTQPYKYIPPITPTPIVAMSVGTVTLTDLTSTGGTLTWGSNATPVEGYMWYVGTGLGTGIVTGGFEQNPMIYTKAFSAPLVANTTYYAWVAPYSGGVGTYIYSTAVSACASLPGTDGYYNVFVSAYTTNGTSKWGAAIMGSNAMTLSTIAIDPSENIYVGGAYSNEVIAITNSSGVTSATLPANGSTNGFIAKYTSTGDLTWATNIAGGGPWVDALAIDASGNAYVAGPNPNGQATFVNVITDSYVIAAGYATSTTSALSTSSNGTTWVSQTPTGLAYSVLCTAWNGSIWVAGGQATSTTSALSTSTDGVTWVSQTPTGLGYAVQCVAWNGSTWVAGGKATSTTSALSTSSNGTTWVSQTITGITGSVNCVAWNGTTWVAGGQSGTTGAISTSTDGVTWVSKTVVGPTSNVKCVAWNGITWVAGGQATSTTAGLSTSSNGTTWVSRTPNGLAYSVNCVGWNGTLFVAGGQATSTTSGLSTSPDGTTWTSRTPTGLTYSVNCVTWNGSIWVAGGRVSATVSALSTSPDGITWTTRTITGLSYSVQSVASRGLDLNNWVGVLTSGNYLVKYTPAGKVTWVATSTPAYSVNSARQLALDSSGNIFIASSYISALTLNNVGGATGATLSLLGTGATNNGYVAKYTPSGSVVWVAQFAPSTGTTPAATCSRVTVDLSNNVYVTGNYGGGSVNLYNTGGTLGTTLVYYAASGSNVFVAKYTSAGNLVWATQIVNSNVVTSSSINTDSNGNVLVSGTYTTAAPTTGSAIAELYVIAGGYTSTNVGALSTSSNGTTWVSQTPTGLAYSVLCTAWNGSIWVAGGRATSTTSALSTSTDGVTWVSQTPTGLSYSVNCIAWNGSIWVAGGQATSTTSALSTSADGVTWTPRTITGITGIVNCVAWNGTTWVAVGQSGTAGALSTSPDAVTWTQRTIVGPTGNVKCVAFSGLSWAIGGTTSAGAGSIAVSTNLINWTTRSISTIMNVVNCILWNGAQWIAGGSATGPVGALATSANGGTTWVSQTITGITGSVNCIAWNGTTWVAGGQSGAAGALSTSPDGVTWTQQTITGITGSVQSIASRGNVYPNVRVSIPTSVTGVQSFLVKYTTNGVVLWMSQIPTASTAFASSTDSNGNVYNTGNYTTTSSVTLKNADATSSAYTLPISSGWGSLSSQYIVSYSSSGVVSNAFVFRPSQPADLSVGQGIAIKGSNLYTTGYYIAQVPTILRTSTYTYPEAVLYNQYTIPCLNSNSPVSWLSVYSPNGSNIWVAEQGPTTVGSAYADTTGGSIGVDSSSNVYILSIHLGTSMTPCNADGTASASFNVMGTTTNLIKYSPTGFVQWVAAASTQFIPLGVSISPPSGNINIAGAFNSNITLGGGYGISGPTLTTTTSGAFVAQYTSGGVVVWASKMILNATTSGVYVYGLATDMSGNIFITGAYGPTTATTFTMYNASGTAGPSVICSATLQYGFIAKYSSTGLAQWIINATGNSNKINGVSVDRNGMVYIAGNFNTSIVIGGTTFAPNPTSTNVYFVSALTSAGNITWMSYIVGDSVGTTITENLSADNYGNIYTVLPTGASDTITVYNPASTLGQTGVSAFTNTIASGGGTIFFKHSSAGTCMWAREGSYGSSARATTDPFGNVYINGSSWYSSLFAKYSPSGKYMFTQYGSSTGGTMRPIAVATGTSGVIYSYGTYTNNLSNALTFTKPI